MDSRTVVRSYIDDISTTYEGKIYYKEVTPPPPGMPPNKITFFQINGVPLDMQGGEIPVDGVERSIFTEIPKGAMCELKSRVEVWV